MSLGLIVYAGALVAALWSLNRPRMGLYYLILVFPAQSIRAQAADFPLGAQLVDLVLLAVVAGILLNSFELDLRGMPMKRLVMVMAAWWFASLWYGSFLWTLPLPVSIADPRFSDWKCIVEMQGLGWIAFIVLRKREQMITALKCMCLGTCYVGVDFLLVMSQRDVSHYAAQVRYSGLMGYAGVNGLGAFAASVAALALGLFLGKRPKQLDAYIVAVLIASAYAVLFSFSRGAYVAFAAGALYLAAVKRSTWLLIVLSLAIFAAGALPGVSERVSATYSGAEGGDAVLDNSAQYRVLVWTDAIELIKTHPLLGTGFGTYRYMHRVSELADTHNYYLKVWLEEGPIGLLLYLAALLAMIRQGQVLFRSSLDPFYKTLGISFAACIVAATVSNIFGDRWTYQQIAAYWWILLAMVGRAQVLSAEENVTGNSKAGPANGMVHASAGNAAASPA
jgi:O-antigen ligase